MLMVVPELLDRSQLEQLNEALRDAKAPWVDGRTTAGHQGAPVKNNQQIDEASALAGTLGHVILTSLERNALFISSALPQRVYPPMFNRYAQGMAFGMHVDGAVRGIAQSKQSMRTDLSATLFLSEPTDYEGGELLIEHQGGTQQVKLAAGDLVVYSAGTRHRVTEVTKGTRLACFFWIQSMVRDDAKRCELYELDQAIQRLNQTKADADALLRLSNHYHNLLRLWCEL